MIDLTFTISDGRVFGITLAPERILYIEDYIDQGYVRGSAITLEGRTDRLYVNELRADIKVLIEQAKLMAGIPNERQFLHNYDLANVLIANAVDKQREAEGNVPPTGSGYDESDPQMHDFPAPMRPQMPPPDDDIES